MLTKDFVRDLCSKTYNTAGKPDWSHILPFYDNNIYIRDSIQGNTWNRRIYCND